MGIPMGMMAGIVVLAPVGVVGWGDSLLNRYQSTRGSGPHPNSFSKPMSNFPGDKPAVLNTSAWAEKRVLFVTAHPDDVEGFAGGLTATLHDQGVNVSYLIVTNGNKGGMCYNATAPTTADLAFRSCESEEIALFRRREMEAAAAVVGVQNVSRFGVPDGMVLLLDETLLRLRLSIAIRHHRPHVIVTHFPYPDFRATPTGNGQAVDIAGWDDLGYHPDHKAVGLRVFEAAYGGGGVADNDHAFPELAEAGLPKWKPDELYFFALTKSQPITHYLPLSEPALQQKIDASFMHRSQYPERAPLEAFTRSIAGRVAGQAGVTGFAEGYQAYF